MADPRLAKRVRKLAEELAVEEACLQRIGRPPGAGKVAAVEQDKPAAAATAPAITDEEREKLMRSLKIDLLVGRTKAPGPMPDAASGRGATPAPQNAPALEPEPAAAAAPEMQM